MRFSVNWQGPFSNLEAEAMEFSKGLYMFISADEGREPRSWVPKDCLYIGMTYDQDFGEEIRAKWAGDVGDWIRRNVEGTILVKVGHIELLEHQKITEQIVKDIECLLIYRTQAPANIQCKKSYTGRLPIHVWNVGNARPLPDFVGATQGTDPNTLDWVREPE